MAAVTYIEKAKAGGNLPPIEDVAASIQEAIVDVLVAKTFNAVEDTGVRVLGAGHGVLVVLAAHRPADGIDYRCRIGMGVRRGQDRDRLRHGPAGGTGCVDHLPVRLIDGD